MAPRSEESALKEDVFQEKLSYITPVVNRKLTVNWKEIHTNLVNMNYSKVVWRNVIIFVLLHCVAVYGVGILLTGKIKWQTFFFVVGMIYLSLFGITMGAHRLWAHRTFKAKLGLRVFLGICQAIALQNCIYDWSRDHRVHHKFSETDADPHNANRGLFFAHMGWLMYRKHPDVKSSGRKVDCSDLLDDWVVRFQKKYYLPLAILFCIVLPTIIPWYFWNESLALSYCTAFAARYCLVLHGTWSVNSFAHWVGNRPYNSYIHPTQNKWVSFFTGGEGWHNYHHTFPFDYRAAELGGFSNNNIVKNAIDICAKLGWAYDLKTVKDTSVTQKANNFGDGTFQGIGVSN